MSATQSVLLMYRDGGGTITQQVDFTGLGVIVRHMYNNPVIVIPTPVYNEAGASPVLGVNVKAINIGFVMNRFQLSFTLTDGCGTMNASGYGTTNYERILAMCNNQIYINPKILWINGTEMPGHIEQFSIAFAGGQKDLALNCTLTFLCTDNIKMVGDKDLPPA